MWFESRLARVFAAGAREEEEEDIDRASRLESVAVVLEEVVIAIGNGVTWDDRTVGDVWGSSRLPTSADMSLERVE